MQKNELCNQVLDILRNHEREQRVIEAQIEHEIESMNRDVDDLASGGYPKMAASLVKVQCGMSDPDAAVVNIVDQISKRRKRSESLIASLSERLQKIDAVQDLVLQMDSKSKTILIALYYPYRTYDQAASLLGIDSATLARQRSIAIERLCTRARNHRAFK